MTELNVVSKTQRIVVDSPSKTVSVINGGPMGPGVGGPGGDAAASQVDMDAAEARLDSAESRLTTNESDIDALEAAGLIYASDISDIQAALNDKLEDAPSNGFLYGRENGAWLGQGPSRYYDVYKTDSNTALGTATLETYITGTYMYIAAMNQDRIIDLSWYVQMTGDCTYAGVAPRYRLNVTGDFDTSFAGISWSSSSQASGYHNVFGRRIRRLLAGDILELRLYGYANISGVVAQASGRTYMTAMLHSAAHWDVLPSTLA